jgi:two-component system sensor histidine kinase UhpB
LATSFGEHAGLRIDRRLERIAALSEEQELVVYRVAQEALTNVARHARANSVQMSLTRETDEVTLRVSDDGCGLPPDALASATGIRGMRERAMLIGAELSIAAAEGGGTEVALRVPAAP